MLFCVFARRGEQAVVGMLFYLLRAAASRPSLECSFIFCAPQGAGRGDQAIDCVRDEEYKSTKADAGWEQ